jgi:hypothetical protein
MHMAPVNYFKFGLFILALGFLAQMVAQFPT